jgi:hypothetical protein
LIGKGYVATDPAVRRLETPEGLSMESMELPKPTVSKILFIVNLNPRSILNHTISNLIIIAQKSVRKDLTHGFDLWSLGKVV